MATKRQRKKQVTTQGPQLLGRAAKGVLLSVFREFEAQTAGIDVATYRVKHLNHWDILDALEQDGYLQRDSTRSRYVLSLIGLAQLNAREAKKLLGDAERIFAEMKKRYAVDPHAKILLTELASTTDLSVEDVRKTLRYMLEMSIWGGHNLTSEGVDAADLYVLPNENVVAPKYRKFREMIVERLRLIEEQKIHSSNRRQLFGMNGKTEGSRTRISVKEQGTATWYRGLKPGVRSLMDEVIRAIEADARTLAAMGLRAVIDMACNDMVTDVGNFRDKLAALGEKGFVTERQRVTLQNALELGHAAAHRGHVPSRKEIDVLRDIVESLLKQLYVHESASERLKKRVPSRRFQQTPL